MERLYCLICTVVLVFISGCAQDSNKELSATADLMDRGYPEEFLNGISEEVREQLRSRPNLTYEDGLVVSTSGDAKQNYGFADDGTLIDKSVLSSNLDFTVTISHDDIANNYVVACDYKWLELPDFRGEDPIVALWNPDLFQLVDDSFYRTDKYDTESSTGNIFIDDHGYASASPAGVVWYSDIPEQSDATAVYGHCEFVLEPKTIIVGCEIHACYIHALVPANLTISNLQQVQFELGNSDIPHTANSARAEAEVDAVIIEGDPSFSISVPDEQHALDAGALIQPPSGNCDPEFEIPVNPTDTDEAVKNPHTSMNPSDIKVVPETDDTMEYIQETVNRIFVGELSYDSSWTHPGTYSLTATENAGGGSDKYTISPIPYYSIWSTPGYRLATEFVWNEVTAAESVAFSDCGYTFHFTCGQRAITVCSHENLLEIELDGVKRFFRGTPLNLNTHSDCSEIFNMFLQFAETAEYEYAEAVRCSVDGSITDYNIVAQKLAEQYAKISANRPGWFSRKAEDAVVSGTTVFDAYYGKDMPNFFFGMGLKLKLTDQQRNYWEPGSGLEEPASDGEYAGYYGWGAEVSVKKGTDGNWHITGLATGGSLVDLPVSWADASAKLLVELYFLTGGQTHDWHILRELAEHPLDDVCAEMNALDPIQAQKLRQGILGFMESYPDYHTWSPSDFS